MVGRDDFLQKDYELKARYLTDHFSRMWIRFNFFLTIESTLVGLSFHKDYSSYVPALCCLGWFLALVWFHFGRTDNFLADHYRTQVGIVFNRLTDLKKQEKWKEENQEPPELLFVGDVPEDMKVRQRVLSGRWSRLSTTELAAFLPLIYLAIWILRLLSLSFSFQKWLCQ